MSDENVGGLVAKWRHMADRAGAESSADSASDELLAALRAEATAYRHCANMLEAALSAHGHPVVDEVKSTNPKWRWDGSVNSDDGVAVYFAGNKGFRIPLPNFKTANIIADAISEAERNAARKAKTELSAKVTASLGATT